MAGPVSRDQVKLVAGMLGGSLLLCSIGWVGNQKVTGKVCTLEKAASKQEA